MGTKYLLGNGTVYVAERAANGLPRNFVSLGNVPELAINFTTDILEHFESESGQNLQDLNIILQKRGEITMGLEEIFPDNLAFLTNGIVNVVATIASQSDTFAIAAAAGVTAGMKFKATKGAGAAITALTLVSVPVATWVITTNYTVDLATGLVTIVTPPAGGPFTSLTLNYSATGATTVSFFTDTSKEYYLAFIGINKAQSGKRTTVDLYRVSFSPVQDLSLIGTEVAKFTLTGKVLADATRGLDATLGPFGRFIYTDTP